jgi:hypothetical protein
MLAQATAGLLPRELRLARAGEKRRQVLRFLRDELWTSADVLGLLMGLPNRQNVHTTLVALERDLLVRRAAIAVPGKHVTLWGITAHGQAMAADDDEEIRGRTFEPSKVPVVFAQHILDVQRLRIAAESAGWTNWVNGDRIERWTTGQKRPDAWAVDLQGRRVAIECERTLKSVKRYQVIVSDWLQAIRRDDVQRVIWVSPSADVCARVRKIITSVTEVRVAGQLVKVPADRYANLYFCDYAQWPTV